MFLECLVNKDAFWQRTVETFVSGARFEGYFYSLLKDLYFEGWFRFLTFNECLEVVQLFFYLHIYVLPLVEI